jgi:hypothetical protein
MAPRFRGDMEVLLSFFEETSPPKIPVQPIELAAMYLVGNASRA